VSLSYFIYLTTTPKDLMTFFLLMTPYEEDLTDEED